MSARTGEGIDELRAALDRASAALASRRRRDRLAGAAAHRSRVHDPGRGHGRHRHAVVGRGRARRRARDPAAGAAGARARRSGPRSAARPGAGGSARGREPRGHRGRRDRARGRARVGRRRRSARLPRRRRARLQRTRARARRARPDPPRHARGGGSAGMARGALLAGPPRAADRPRGRRPARGPPGRAAGHAGRRAGCSTHGRAGTARAATLLVRLERLARGEELPPPSGRASRPRGTARSASGLATTGPAALQLDAGEAGPNATPVELRPRLGAATARGRRRAPDRLGARRRRPGRAARRRTRGARVQDAPLPRRIRWTRSARALVALAGATVARSRSRSCATSWAPRASSRRRCSSTSTPRR